MGEKQGIRWNKCTHLADGGLGHRWIKASEFFGGSQELGLCFPLLVEMKVATLAIAAERMCSWQRALRGRLLFKRIRLKVLFKLDHISPSFWKDFS